MTSVLGLGYGLLIPRTPSKQPKNTLAVRRAAANSSITNHTRLGGLQNTAKQQQPQDDSLYANGYFSGLKNTGNSCFFNSTVQSLASVPALQTYLQQVIDGAERWDIPTPVTDAIVELLDQLNSPGNRTSCINPTLLTNALRSLPSSPLRSLVSAHQQQDAHELFVLLSDALEHEMRAITHGAESVQRSKSAGFRSLIGPSLPWVSKSVYSLSAQNGATSTLLFPRIPLLSKQEGEESIPQLLSPFNALLAQRTICLDCGYMEAIRHFSSEELSLGVPARNQPTRTSQVTGTSACSLEECLQMWCELEPVDWICWRCSLANTRLRIHSEVSRLEESNEAKVSSSKKKRLRDARNRESRVGKVLTSGLSEDEIAALSKEPNSAFYGILNGIKLDRQPSRTSTKQHMLSRPPKVLCIHLNRSTFSATAAWGGASKNNRQVIFPEYLDVSPFCLGGQIGVDGSKGMDLQMESSKPRAFYRLCSIVVHYGGHSFGHYVSYRRAPGDGGWLRISDETVRRVDVRDVLQENPFMLFYEQIPAPYSNGTLRLEEAGTPTGYAAPVRPRIVHRWSTQPESARSSPALM